MTRTSASASASSIAAANSVRMSGVIVLYSAARVKTIERTPASVSVRSVRGMGEILAHRFRAHQPCDDGAPRVRQQRRGRSPDPEGGREVRVLGGVDLQDTRLNVGPPQ